SSSAARKAMWWTEAPAQEVAGNTDIDDAADLGPVRVEAHCGPLAADLREPEHVREDRASGRRLAQEQADAVEASDRILGRHAAVPCRLVPDPWHGDKREPRAVRVFERVILSGSADP